MGNLISADMLADILINIINIVVLFLVTKKLVYKPVKKMIEDRKNKALEASRSADEKMKAADEKQALYEKKLSSLEAQSADMEKQTRQNAVESAETILSDARSKADEIVSDAKKNAAIEKEKIMSSAKRDIADAAVEISGRIIGRKINDEDNMKIIDSFFEESDKL